MSIIVKGSNFIPCPAGNHNAVCVDVVDLGELEMTFNGHTKKKQVCRLTWQVDEVMENGKPFLVSKRYTQSLDRKSNLRKDLVSWRGQDFTADELAGFDLENVVGKGCLVNVVHAEREGVTYANVTGVSKLPKGMPKLKPRDYLRVKDREPQKPTPPAMDEDDDDVPTPNDADLTAEEIFTDPVPF